MRTFAMKTGKELWNQKFADAKEGYATSPVSLSPSRGIPST